MTEQLVTIGLPFARTPVHYLELAVRSVFAQTHTRWELVLLADGSLPDLEQRLEAITDPRVRLMRDPENLGLAARLNQVAELASGDVLFRMDGDDVMHPERLERTLAALGSGHAEVVGTRAYAVDAATEVMGLFREGPVPAELPGFLRSNAFTHPTVAGRTQWFRDNPYDETLKRSEDKDLWLRAAGHSRFAKLDDALMFYRLADLSAGKQGRDARFDRLLLRRHGPVLVGRGRTVGKLATSYAKQAVFAGLDGLGQESVIVRRKVSPLSAQQAHAARVALQAVRAATVPGWAS